MSNNHTHIIIPSFLLCIVIISLQVIIMGLPFSYIVTLLLCSIIVLSTCYILITYYRDYGILFTYTFILTILSTIILYMLFLFRQNHDLSLAFDNEPKSNLLIDILLKLPFDNDNTTLGLPLFILIILNCALPFISGILVCLFDTYNRYRHFNRFFIQHSIFTLLLYSLILIYMLLIKQNLYEKKSNLVPFMTIAAYIEDYILENLVLSESLKFIIYNSILFIPYGFYVQLVTKGANKLIKLITLAALPFLFEIINLVAFSKTFDIDCILLAVIGGIIGIMIFKLLNYTFLTIKEKEFLNDDSYYIS